MPYPYTWNFAKSPAKLLKSAVIEATATLNFASIATVASETLTIAAPGAVVGDAVSVSCAAAGGPTAGLVYTAWVSAADVVSVKATNITLAAVDAAALAFVVLVVQK